ncbi:unnamed protein product [Closterium sp. NIES-54]
MLPHHQQQSPQTAPVRNVMGNMTMTSGSRRPRARSPSPEPARQPIGAFSNNNPFSTRHDFTNDDEQDWNLPVPLLESPPHIPDQRAAPIDWILSKKFLNFDTPHIAIARLALLARNDNRRYNTWNMDSCCGQHMARGSRTHITPNDVLIMQNLRFNLLSAVQLMNCGVDLSTKIETRDIRCRTRRAIGRAHSENGVYFPHFGIPDCSGDSKELIDLVPLRFEHIHHRDWKHPDGRPWVPHHAHPHEVALHDPDPDDICRDCHTPTASTSAIAGRCLVAITKAEREAPPEEGLSNLELETATCVVFGTKENPLPRPASQHLRGMLRGTGVGTFDANGVPRPYTKEKFMEIYSHQRKSAKNLTVAQEEELARHEVEALRQRSLAESCGTFAWSGWGEEQSASNEGGWGSAGGWGTSDTGGWGAASGGETSGWGTSGEVWRASREDQRGEKEEIEAEPPVVPLGRPPRRAVPALPPPDIQPGSDPWDTIDWGNEPSTLRRTVYGPAPEPREPTFFHGTIRGTNIPLSNILDIEFLALMLTMANEDDEAEDTAAEPAQAPDKDPAEAHARYMWTYGFRADDTIWHQRLGHPSRLTLKNCIEADVFVPDALLRHDGTEVRGATHPPNCTVYPEAVLSHQPLPLLEPRTNRYAKQEKVYSDFLNVGHCGSNDELYTLTFVDVGMRYVWVVNVEACSRAYEVFRPWLAHAQRQSREKLKIWQSDGATEFRSKEMQDYLAKKGIEHHVSLPYAHQQQGIVERTNRTLMTKVRALMKQSKLPPTYWTYAMHHAVRVHNLLSTTAITGNSSPHVKRIGTKGNTSMLRVQKIQNVRDVIFYEWLFFRQFREDEQANANRVHANDGRSYASPEDEAAAAILEQDPRGEFTRGNHHDDDNDNSSGGGAGATCGGSSGSGKGAALPAPPEPESDDDDVQEVTPQHRHDSTVSGIQLLGLHTATSMTPRVIEPKNPRQALTGPHIKEWREAMDTKIKALESRDTWVLVHRATIKGRRILSGKWVFRVKTVANGTIERFKARWVVRGYDHRHGIDFDQTFAPVNRHTSVRILLAIAAARHLPLQQIDVKNAFLYALVDAAIYVEQPHTYGEGDSCVCQLRKSLYGIKQVPRLWQQYLHNILLEIDFKQLPHDPGMYRRDFRSEYIPLTVYVDDILYTGSSNEPLEQFEKNLAGRVDITCNHDAKHFLGLNISYSPQAIHLSAAKYAEELGKRFNMAPTPLSTPAGLHTYQQ